MTASGSDLLVGEPVAADPSTSRMSSGFTRIPNDLMDAILAFPFTGRQQKVLLTLLRKTYGFSKASDDISASQVGGACGLNRTHVTATLNRLAEMHVIHKVPGVYGSVMSINSDNSEWQSASTKSVQGVPKWQSASTKSVQVASTKSVHTKENLPKENQQKKKPCASADAFARFWSAYPKKRSKGQAEKTFSKLNPSEQLMDAMLAAIGRAKTSEQWTRDDGQYIPHPSTWLNNRGWEDEIQESASAPLTDQYGVLL